MIKTMKTLIRREFWEHRGAFIKAPIIVSIVLLAIALVGYIVGLVFASKTGSVQIMNKGIDELHNLSQEQLTTFWDIQILSTSSLFLFVLFIVVFFYLLGSLFDDRKDGSIQFWKSLPISDSETVISKLLTAMIFVPITATVIFSLYMFISLVLTSLLLLIHGQNPWVLIWQPANLFTGVFTMFMGAMVQMIWALPIYGWLMFCSAWTKRRPFLFSVFIPLLVAVSWYVLNVITRLNFFQIDMFKWPAKYFFIAVVPYGSGAGSEFQLNLGDNGSTMGEILKTLLGSFSHIDLVYGAIFCSVFIALSIWVRRYRNTT